MTDFYAYLKTLPRTPVTESVTELYEAFGKKDMAKLAGIGALTMAGLGAGAYQMYNHSGFVDENHQKNIEHSQACGFSANKADSNYVHNYQLNNTDNIDTKSLAKDAKDLASNLDKATSKGAQKFVSKKGLVNELNKLAGEVEDGSASPETVKKLATDVSMGKRQLDTWNNGAVCSDGHLSGAHATKSGEMANF